jgi:hypothetical protein
MPELTLAPRTDTRSGVTPVPNPKTSFLPKVRVTEDERAEIERRARASGFSLSDYMRRRAKGEECPPVQKQRR